MAKLVSTFNTGDRHVFDAGSRLQHFESFVRDLKAELADVHSLLVIHYNHDLRHYSSVLLLCENGVLLLEKLPFSSYFFEFSSGILYQNKIPLDGQHVGPFTTKILRICAALKTRQCVVFEGREAASVMTDDSDEPFSGLKAVAADLLGSIRAGRDQAEIVSDSWATRRDVLDSVLDKLQGLPYSVNLADRYQLSETGFWQQQLADDCRRFSRLLYQHQPEVDQQLSKSAFSSILKRSEFATVSDFCRSFKTLKQRCDGSLDDREELPWLMARFNDYLDAHMAGHVTQNMSYLLTVFNQLSAEHVELRLFVAWVVLRSLLESDASADRLLKDRLRQVFYALFIGKDAVAIPTLEGWQSLYAELTVSKWMANDHCLLEHAITQGLQRIDLFDGCTAFDLEAMLHENWRDDQSENAIHRWNTEQHAQSVFAAFALLLYRWSFGARAAQLLDGLQDQLVDPSVQALDEVTALFNQSDIVSVSDIYVAFGVLGYLKHHAPGQLYLSHSSSIFQRLVKDHKRVFRYFIKTEGAVTIDQLEQQLQDSDDVSLAHLLLLGKKTLLAYLLDNPFQDDAESDATSSAEHFIDRSAAAPGGLFVETVKAQFEQSHREREDVLDLLSLDASVYSPRVDVGVPRLIQHTHLRHPEDILSMWTASIKGVFGIPKRFRSLSQLLEEWLDDIANGGSQGIAGGHAQVISDAITHLLEHERRSKYKSALEWLQRTVSLAMAPSLCASVLDASRDLTPSDERA